LNQLQRVETVNSLSYSLQLNSMLMFFLYTLPPVCELNLYLELRRQA
jgi:hypothetical protein